MGAAAPGGWTGAGRAMRGGARGRRGGEGGTARGGPGRGRTAKRAMRGRPGRARHGTRIFADNRSALNPIHRASRGGVDRAGSPIRTLEAAKGLVA